MSSLGSNYRSSNTITPTEPPSLGGGTPQSLSDTLTIGNSANGTPIIDLSRLTFNDTINQASIKLATGLGSTLNVVASDNVTPANINVGTINCGNLTASNTSVISTTGTGYVTTGRVNIDDLAGSSSVDLKASANSTLNVYEGGTSNLATLNAKILNANFEDTTITADPENYPGLYIQTDNTYGSGTLSDPSITVDRIINATNGDIATMYAERYAVSHFTTPADDTKPYIELRDNSINQTSYFYTGQTTPTFASTAGSLYIKGGGTPAVYQYNGTSWVALGGGISGHLDMQGNNIVNVSQLHTEEIHHPTDGLYMTLDDSINRTVLNKDLGFADTRNAIMYIRQNALIGLRIQDNGSVPYMTFDTTTNAGRIYAWQQLNIGGLVVGAVASSISTNTTFDLASTTYRNISVIELTTTHTSGGIFVMFSNPQAGRTFKIMLKSLAAGGSVFFSNITVPVTVNKGQEGRILEFYCDTAGNIILVNPIYNTYICRKHLSADQSYTAGQSAIVQFNTTTFNVPNSNWVDTTTNTNGFVITEAGYYRIHLNIQWSSLTSSTGRTAQIRLSTDAGSTWAYISQEVNQSNTVVGVPNHDCTAVVNLAVGDWIGANANNGSASTINIAGGNTNGTLGINSFMLLEKLT